MSLRVYMSYYTPYSAIIIAMKKQAGFTVVELLVTIILLLAAGALFLQQKSHIEGVDRDRQRKTAINAMYYSLEEVYYQAHKSYPRKLSTENLPSVDPDLFKDPDNVMIGDTGSDYQYEPTQCEADVCVSFTLRTRLENEADYTKKSVH